MAQDNNIRRELTEIRELLNLLGQRLEKIESEYAEPGETEPVILLDSPNVSEASIPVVIPTAMAPPSKLDDAIPAPEPPQTTPADTTSVPPVLIHKTEPSPAVLPNPQPKPAPARKQLASNVETQSKATQPSRPTPGAPIPSALPKSSSESLESWIGGRVFTWAGGVLLILSTAFFVVWSWRYLDLPPWARVLMLHAGGFAVIGCAAWFKKRLLKLHSEVLYGVGIFALYASGLAMTHLYALGKPNPELLGFVDLAIITSIAIAISLRNKSMGIILLGACGGYLTPFVTLQGSDPIITFIYLAFL